MTEEDITQDPEYIRGYEKYMQNEKELEERRKSPYMKGWMDAGKEMLYQHAIEEESKAKENRFESQEDPLNQLRNEIKSLDERLKNLEKYTQE